MKLNILVFSMLILVVAALSGCSSQTAEVAKIEETPKSEVELVPARKSDDEGSETVVVERDGKYYEMLKEHERLCSDCDR